MYMVDHDIVLIAGIATTTNWTRHRGPFASAKVLNLTANALTATLKSRAQSRGEPMVTLLECCDTWLQLTTPDKPQKYKVKLSDSYKTVRTQKV